MPEMTETQQRIDAIVQVLSILSASFIPGNAAAIAALLQAGSKLNRLVQQIRDQTEADSPEVWDEVREHYLNAVEDFEASVDPSLR